MTTIAISSRSSAISRYSGFDFDSFLQVGDAIFGIDDAGLHLLGGDDDDGEAIQSRIETDWIAPAGDRLTRMDRMTLRYSGSRVVVHATQGEGGHGTEMRYELAPQTAGVPRNGVVKIGKGPAALAWKFAIITEGPATISGVEVAPLPTTRTR